MAVSTPWLTRRFGSTSSMIEPACSSAPVDRTFDSTARRNCCWREIREKSGMASPQTWRARTNDSAISGDRCWQPAGMFSPASGSTIAWSTQMFTPPSARTTPSNPARFTVTNPLIWSPVRRWTTFATRYSPSSNADVILPMPTCGMCTHRSRGNESTVAWSFDGSMCRTMIVSDRRPGTVLFDPYCSCSALDKPVRESLPRIR